VKVMELPELPNGGDVVEYIDARDSMDTEAIAGSIIALADGVPFINPAELIGGPVLVCLADVEPTEISWLWPGRIPLGVSRCWWAGPVKARVSQPAICRHG